MRTARSGLYIIYIISILVFSALPVSGASHGYGEIVIIPETQLVRPLADRWDEALEIIPASSSGGWTGYSIEIHTESESRFGNPGQGEPSLQTMIEDAGGTVRADTGTPDADRAGEYAYQTLAILVYRPDSTSGAYDIAEVRICSVDLYTGLGGQPLVWLGEATQEESCEFLISAYNQIVSNKTKEDIILAIGLHQECPAVIPFLENIITVTADDDIREEAVFWLALQKDHDVIPFLSNVILNDTSVNVRKQAVFATGLIKNQTAREVLFQAARSNDDQDVREQAIFWLAEADTPDVLTYLIEIITTDPSEHVRKEAVFGLSRMNTEGALDALIKVARSSENAEVQKQAIFWLGQAASRKSAEALTGITYDNASIDMQRQAVFALSQSKHPDNIPLLIDIAREHPNPDIRSQAVFWLGQSGDPRALDVLISIVREP